MEVSANGGEDGGFNERPVVNDHGVVEPERAEPECHGGGIPHSITVACLAFMRRTVGLEDETVADHEIHMANTRDVDLAHQRQPVPVEAQTQERLEAAVGVRAREVDEPPGAGGHVTSNPLTRLIVEKSEPQRGLQRREEALLAAASQDLEQTMDDADSTERRFIHRVVSMEDAAIGGVRLGIRIDHQSCRVILGMHPRVDALRVAVIEDPQPVVTPGRDARDGSAMAQRFKDSG